MQHMQVSRVALRQSSGVRSLRCELPGSAAYSALSLTRFPYTVRVIVSSLVRLTFALSLVQYLF